MTHPTYDAADVPGWPAYTLTVYADGRVDAAGPLVPSATHAHRGAAIGAVAEASARLGRPVRAQATEADGTVWLLVVTPDGSVGELTGAPTPPQPRKRRDKSAEKAEKAKGKAKEKGRDKGGENQDPRPTTTTTTTPTAPPAPAPKLSRLSRKNRSATASSVSKAAAEPDPGAFSPALALVAEHLEAGRVDAAAELAARLDERASAALGISHPDALRIREVWARITALLGDTAGGVRLFRDVAERWLYQGAHENAESAAARAVTLWLQITDLDEALAAGFGIIRMRNQIPGEGAGALTEALRYQAHLEGVRGETPGAGGLGASTPVGATPARPGPPRGELGDAGPSNSGALTGGGQHQPARPAFEDEAVQAERGSGGSAPRSGASTANAGQPIPARPAFEDEAVQAEAGSGGAAPRSSASTANAGQHQPARPALEDEAVQAEAGSGGAAPRSGASTANAGQHQPARPALEDEANPTIEPPSWLQSTRTTPEPPPAEDPTPPRPTPRSWDRPARHPVT
ncbi:hypothetical protein ACIQOU_29145 [Streptomyces sp. NPDC091279]|uniref:hypothetical protein n=1 Tax=Streptomyces sp. NPDC091279 TaxID=3365983 RepID=UPI00380D84FA